MLQYYIIVEVNFEKHAFLCTNPLSRRFYARKEVGVTEEGSVPFDKSNSGEVWERTTTQSVAFVVVFSRCSYVLTPNNQ